MQGLAEAPWLDLETPAATGPFNGGHFSSTHPNSGAQADSHTLVVDREDAARYGEGGRYGDGGRRQGGGREPFLGRWLFGPRLVIVALIIALGIGLGLGGWWLTSGRYAQVPTVSMDSVSQATTALTADGFAVRPAQRQVHSNIVSKGMVVGTSPAGRVSKGTAVTILVSSGPFTSQVPVLKGQKQGDAQAALQHLHLTFTVVKVGANAPVGTVTGTNPPAGTVCRRPSRSRSWSRPGRRCRTSPGWTSTPRSSWPASTR